MGEAKDTVIFIVHSLVSSSIRTNEESTSPCRQIRIPSGRVYSAITIYEPGLPKCVTCEWLFFKAESKFHD